MSGRIAHFVIALFQGAYVRRVVTPDHKCPLCGHDQLAVAAYPDDHEYSMVCTHDGCCYRLEIMLEQIPGSGETEAWASIPLEAPPQAPAQKTFLTPSFHRVPPNRPQHVRT